MGAFQVSKNKIGKFVFRLLASNGQIILSSEAFETKAAAAAAIRKVSESARAETNFERRSTTDGNYYFVLKATNGRVLGKSEVYASQAGLENGIWSVAKYSDSLEARAS